MSFDIRPETDVGGFPTFSLRARNVDEAAFVAWTNKQISKWTQAGYPPVYKDKPVQFLNGEWCLIVKFKNNNITINIYE